MPRELKAGVFGAPVDMQGYYRLLSAIVREACSDFLSHPQENAMILSEFYRQPLVSYLDYLDLDPDKLVSRLLDAVEWRAERGYRRRCREPAQRNA